MGMLLSAFFWTYASRKFPSAGWRSAIGAHRVLAAGLALWASATILVGCRAYLRGLLVLRLLLGLGESAGFPSVAKILAAVVPARRAWARPMASWPWDICRVRRWAPYCRRPADGAFRLALGVLGFGALSLLWLLPWSRVAGQVRTAVRAAQQDSPTWWMILRQPSLWGTALGPVLEQLCVLFHAVLAALVSASRARILAGSTWRRSPTLRYVRQCA